MLGRLLARGAPLLAAGLVGGGIAVGVGIAVNGSGGTETTVVREVAGFAQQPASFEGDEGALSVQEIYRRSAPGVVQITATSDSAGGDPFLDPFQPSSPRRALGSGFVIDKAGHIVTNFHVVQGAREVEVNFSENDPVRAKVLGTDPSTDLALLEVEVPARALTPLPLGNSDTVQVGDQVVAIGNPFGLDRTVTSGIVSAVQRHIQAPDGYPIDNVIQTDAAINSGNSGGPLLNARGEVIGVNSQIETGGRTSGNVGIGFAVPVNTVREVVSQILESGTVEHAYIGIEMQDITPALARTFRLPVDRGILIANVRPDSPADKAGLRGGDTSVIVDGQNYLLGGDVITAVDGRPVANSDDVRKAILGKKPGDTVTLEVRRDDATRSVTVELGRRPQLPTG